MTLVDLQYNAQVFSMPQIPKNGHPCVRNAYAKIKKAAIYYFHE